MHKTLHNSPQERAQPPRQHSCPIREWLPPEPGLAGGRRCRTTPTGAFYGIYPRENWQPKPVEELGRVRVPLSLIHISEPTRLGMISYAVFCLKKKKKKH